MLSTHLKHISQIRSFPQIGVNINNIWHHHPVTSRIIIYFSRGSQPKPSFVTVGGVVVPQAIPVKLRQDSEVPPPSYHEGFDWSCHNLAEGEKSWRGLKNWFGGWAVGGWWRFAIGFFRCCCCCCCCWWWWLMSLETVVIQQHIPPTSWHK